MTAARVAAGVPTGGQFAPSGHSEPTDTRLDAATGAHSHAAELGQSFDARTDDRGDSENATSVAAIKLITANVKARWPQARYLEVDWSDQGAYLTAKSIRDGDDSRLDDPDAEFGLASEDLIDSGHCFDSALSFVEADTWSQLRDSDFGRRMMLDLELVDHLYDPEAPPAAAGLPENVHRYVADLRARDADSAMPDGEAADELRKLLRMLGD